MSKTVRLTTVDVQPVDVTLHTLRFQGKTLTSSLYQQILQALPFSEETWTLNSDLLGWVNLALQMNSPCPDVAWRE